MCVYVCGKPCNKGSTSFMRMCSHHWIVIGDTACHWDCDQRSYQWNGVSSLACWTYLQSFRTWDVANLRTTSLLYMSCTLAAIWSSVIFWVFEFDFDDLAHFILFHPLLSGCFQVCVCVRVCVNVYNQACPSWVWYLENGGLNPEHGNVERWTFQRLGLSSKNLGEYADVLYITFYIHRSGMLMDMEDLATKHGGTKPINGDILGHENMKATVIVWVYHGVPHMGISPPPVEI